MNKDGLAKTPSGTTSAPDKIFTKVPREDDDEVARGHARAIEIIVYEFDREEEIIDEFSGEGTGKMRKIEKSRGPYWCQNAEQERIFKENNPGVRIETFNIQLLESTAQEYMDKPENIAQFVKIPKKEVDNG